MPDHASVDPVTMYLRELSTIVPLTKEEERQLFRKLGGSGDCNDEKESVARRLIETHLKLVVGVVEEHLSSGIPMLDLLQEGNLGLMNAIRSFAEQPVGDFGSYATNRIEESSTKALAKHKF